MGSQFVIRAWLLVVLFWSSAVPGAGIATSAGACDTPESSPGIGVISEGFGVLSSYYVEPLTPSLLLAAAAESTRAEVQRTAAAAFTPDPPKSFGDDAAALSRFAAYYCQLWDVAMDGTDPTIVAYAGVRAMASVVNEAHTQFLTPEMYRAQREGLSGNQRYEGIGARLRSNPLTVDYVFPGSPAEAEGLRAGDQIISIDGQMVADVRAEDAVGQVRGEPGTQVTLVVRRPDANANLTFVITRATIRIPNLEARLIDDVAHLRIFTFPVTPLNEEVAAELEWFNAVGARALIVDLRGNSGGVLDVGSRVAGLFLPDGAPIYQRTTRSGRQTTRVNSSGTMWNRPIVVLIDQGTASMAEILAAALKEQAGATLIGATTAGAVAGSISVPLSDGSAVQVTTQRIDSSLGRILNVVGLRPDIAIAAPESGTRGANDPVLEAALSHLRRPAQAGPAPGTSHRVVEGIPLAA